MHDFRINFHLVVMPYSIKCPAMHTSALMNNVTREIFNYYNIH